MGCIESIKGALSECSIKQRLRWLETLSAAVPDAWASLKADITLFRADDTVKEALLGWSQSFRLLNWKKCGHAPRPQSCLWHTSETCVSSALQVQLRCIAKIAHTFELGILVSTAL